MSFSLRLLFLEGSAAVARSVQRELRQADLSFTLKRVKTKKTFLESLKTFAPDVALVDYSARTLSGESALQGVKQCAPAVPFIVLTKVIRADTAVECMKAGAADCIPIKHLRRLVPAIKSALDKRRAYEERARTEAALKKSNEELETKVAERTEALNRVNEQLLRELIERKKVEVQFRGLLESAPDAILVVDRSRRIQIMNSQAERLFGYSRDELMGKPMEHLLPERVQRRHVEHCETYFRSPQARLMGVGLDLAARRKDGSEFPVDVSLSPMAAQEGLLAITIIRDISERKRVEDQIRASLREKEVLLREVYHRVKNNLQIVSSLMSLQSDYVRDERDLQVFKESQNRIRLMALLHEKLFQSQDLARIDFAAYLRDLVAGLFKAYSVDTQKVHVEIDVTDVMMTLDTAVPMGLLINELVSNSLKHAFPNGRSGEITISLCSKDSTKVELRIADNGVGIPESLDIEAADTLGLRLVKILVHQLKGTLQLRKTAGTEFLIAFEEAEH